MNYNINEIISFFDKVKSEKEYVDYIKELSDINSLLNTFPFNNAAANQMCSYLSTKYKEEIEKHFSNTRNPIRVISTNTAKNDIDIINDLRFFQNYIPLFALDRTVKSEIQRQILGLN